MPSNLVHTSAAPTAASAMRDIAARTAAARRTAEGVAAHDPAYGMWVCTCICRRCIPYKNDCGGCIEPDGCRLEFMTHQAASNYFASWGIRYNPRTHRFE